jgi:molecular chaperone DnaK (HSP70)
MDKDYNICIDFGTCNSVISYVEDNVLKQIQDDVSGDVLIPTTIYFIHENISITKKITDLEPEYDFIIGNVASELVNTNKDWENYFFQFKRFLGITSKSISAYNDFLKRYNFDYTTDEDTIYFYLKSVEDNEFKLKFTIIDLIKLFFKGLKKLITNKLNISQDNLIKIILTCPAYFHDLQRTQLKRAAEQAGFEVFKLVNEPTAAAIYYIAKYHKTNIQDKYIIYDLGGGTIDTTVIEYYPESNICEVLDIDGNNGLGGIDIDNIITYDIINRYSIDKSNIKWLNKIKKYSEEIKIKLTCQTNYDIYLENVPIIKSGEICFVDSLKISYSRQLFNNLINQLIDDMIQPIKNMYTKYNTSNIIFIGGPTQIPLLQSKVNSFIDNNNITKSNQIINEINENKTESNITTIQSQTADLILYKTIVSQGGSIFYKKIITKEEFCLLDILPMNIGISDPENNMIVMIEKNSKIPVSIERIFSTSHDCQRSIDIDVYEGIEKSCLSNTFIGSYKIIGIPPLPKGMVLIKLLFKISYNGILEISIVGTKNPSDHSAKSFDFKFNENIRLIPKMIAKEILKKILLLGEKK